MAVGESIVNGALGLIGTGMQLEFEQGEAQKEREWNEAMMNKQNEWNLNMWNMTNEYNSPANQRKRMEEAGLNPLYYGLDGSSASGMESAQALGYQRASMQGMDNPIQSALNAGLIRAQIENTQSDTAKKNNENITETQRRENMKVELDKWKQEIDNMELEAQKIGAETASIELGNKWIERLNQANLNYIESEAKLNESTRYRIDSLVEGEKLLQSKSIEDFDYRWKQIKAEINKISKETGLLEKDLEDYALNHSQGGVFGSGLSLPNIIRLKRENPSEMDHPESSETYNSMNFPDMGNK